MKKSKLFLWLACCIVGALCAAPAHSALVAFYNFEEGTPPDGLILDTGTGAAMNMTKIGSPIYSSDTPVNGTGLAFGGKSLQIGPPNSYAFANPGANTKMELVNFTLETWVKPVAGGGTLFAYDPEGAGATGQGYLLLLDASNRPSFQAGRGIGPFFSAQASTALTPNVWHHVAGSIDGSILRVFVDGVQEASTDMHGNILYFDNPGQGPVPKTAYMGIFHNGNPTGSTDNADLILPLPVGTLLDRIRLEDQVTIGIGGNGTAAPSLDFFTPPVPEPASLLLFFLAALTLPAHRRR